MLEVPTSSNHSRLVKSRAELVTRYYPDIDEASHLDSSDPGVRARAHSKLARIGELFSESGTYDRAGLILVGRE